MALISKVYKHNPGPVNMVLTNNSSPLNICEDLRGQKRHNDSDVSDYSGKPLRNQIFADTESCTNSEKFVEITTSRNATRVAIPPFSTKCSEINSALQNVATSEKGFI